LWFSQSYDLGDRDLDLDFDVELTDDSQKALQNWRTQGLQESVCAR